MSASNTPKYELTEDVIMYNGIKLSRIRALRNFANIKVGQLGGYVSDEGCLSQTDRSWIYAEDCLVVNSVVNGDTSIESKCIIVNSHIFCCAVGVLGSTREITIKRSKLKNVDILGDAFINNSEMINCQIDHRATMKLKSVMNSNLQNVYSEADILYIDRCELKNLHLKDVAELNRISLCGIARETDVYEPVVMCSKCDYDYDGEVLKLTVDKKVLNTKDVLMLIEEAKNRKEKNTLKDRADTIRNNLV